MTKQTMREQIIQIALMSKKELNDYATKISMSMMGDKEKKILFKAVDRMFEYYGVDSESALAVSASIDLD